LRGSMSHYVPLRKRTRDPIASYILAGRWRTSGTHRAGSGQYRARPPSLSQLLPCPPAAAPFRFVDDPSLWPVPPMTCQRPQRGGALTWGALTKRFRRKVPYWGHSRIFPNQHAKGTCLNLLPFISIWQPSCATKKASFFSPRPNHCANVRLCSTLNRLHYSLRVLVREDSVMTPIWFARHGRSFLAIKRAQIAACFLCTRQTNIKMEIFPL